MEMKYFLFPFFYILFCSPTESKSADIESVIRFGDSLFLRGIYIKALNEYHRAYFFSGSELKSQVGGKIADCYMVLNDFKMARSFYDTVLFYSKNESQRISCEFQKILCFMKENNFGYALIKINNLVVKDVIQLQRRKSLYQGICNFGIGQYDASYTYFINSISKTDTIRRLQIQHLFETQKVLKRPKSNVAIMLSLIIPGTGQFYSGDIKNGLNSLLLLSGIIYLGTVVSSSGLVIIVPLFLRYYIGGVVHAKQIADRKREEQKHIYYTNLMEILLK
jgi:tetratricopeptide (TPR) repeat protein